MHPNHKLFFLCPFVYTAAAFTFKTNRINNMFGNAKTRFNVGVGFI